MNRPTRLAVPPVRRGREAFVDVAYDNLKAQIFIGPLEPGDRVSVESAMERLRVSRQPVRDAVNRLALEGFVVVIPQGRQFGRDPRLVRFVARTAAESASAIHSRSITRRKRAR